MFKKTLNSSEIQTQKMLEAALMAWIKKISPELYIEIVRLDLKSKSIDGYTRIICSGHARMCSVSPGYTQQLRFNFSVDWERLFCPTRWPNGRQPGEEMSLHYVEANISGKVVHFTGKSSPQNACYEIDRLVRNSSILDFAVQNHFKSP